MPESGGRMLKDKFGIKSEKHIDKKITETIREEGDWCTVSTDFLIIKDKYAARTLT